METTTIDFMPLIAPLLVALVSILVGFITAAANKLRIKWGLDADEKSIMRVREAIQNGVNYGREMLEVAIKDKVRLDVKNEIARNAATYAVRQIPSVIEKLGYDSDHLENWAFSVLATENQSAEYYKPMELEPPAESKGS